MVVLDPLEVVIVSGIDKDDCYTVPDFPRNAEKGSHEVAFSSKIYIEKTDFRIENVPGYKRLTGNQTVGLRYTPYLIRLSNIIFDDNSKCIKKIEVIAEKLDNSNRPPAYIHWVSDPIEITVRLYNNLFKHKNPEDTNEVPDGYLSDLSSDSFNESKALADKYILRNKESFYQYQFERTGYFSIDPDTTEDNLIFNRTLLLKEDPSKN